LGSYAGNAKYSEGAQESCRHVENVNNPEAQAAYGRATDAINKIESALKGHGI